MLRSNESVGQHAHEGLPPARDTASLCVRLFLAVVATAAVVAVPAIAFAGEGTSSASPELPADALQQAVNASDTSELQLTDPQAAEELPHSDLGRAEALDLNEAVFGVLLKSAAGPGQNLEVEKYLSDNAAVISVDSQPDASVTAGVGEAVEESPLPSSTGEESVLLDSSTPLRTEGPNGNKEPVSLGLEAVGDHLEPESPLVKLEVPRELGDGIILPDSGVRINLANAHQGVAPSLVGDTVATYPNVAEDTDFSAVPVPAGLETLTTLRSAKAPDEQKYDLTLPSGADLRQDGEGAEVVQGGKTVLRILPPSALDANGEKVPATLDVAESSFTVTVSPGPEAAYPLLVDPLYEDHDWNVTHEVGMDSWKGQQTPGANMWFHRFPESFSIGSWSGFQPANSQAGVTYSVPRLSEEEAAGRMPNSYIAGLTVWHIGFWNAGSNPGFSPYLFSGIWGGEGHWAGKPGQAEAVWSLAGNSPNAYMNPGWGVTMKNGTSTLHDGGAKVAWGLGIATQENTSLAWTRQADLGAAAVEVADENNPGIANPNVLPWQDATAKGNVQATAQDAGLGVKVLNFRLPGQTVATNVVNPCLGTAANPCPYQWTAQLPAAQASPANMPQGYDYVSITSEDLLGNQSPTPVKAMIPVDHTSPSLGVSGSITEQGTVGTIAPEYKLNYEAKDGDTAEPAALTPIGSPGTSEGKLGRPIGVATDASGNIYVADKNNSRIEKFDSTGKFLSQFGTTGTGQLKEPRGIAVATNGDIWVADAGNARVVAFTSAGVFKSTFGSKGPGGGTEFVAPFGIAIAKGTGALANQTVIYVSDEGGKRVGAFIESGSFLGNVTGSSGNPSGPASFSEPQGIAMDPNGNLWVADAVNNQVQKFDSAGKFSMQFGTYGSGNGQFKEPVGVAIAASGNVLVTDGNNNRVQEFRPDGTFVRAFGSTGTGNAQFVEPRGIAIGPGNTAYIADATNARIAKWSHASYDPQSGAAKTEVKVDGTPIEPAYNPGCATENCVIHREWTLKASKYASGAHSVQVSAWDGVNRLTTKTLNISTVKDMTPPELTANGSFFTAPEGWVEQKTYAYSAAAKDTGGYGVTSLVLKVDGKVVKTTSHSCPNGGCESLLSGSINMATYKGGAHPAELTATDGAGLVSKKLWTINVDPAGVVAAGEAMDTIEAVEATSPNAAPIAPNSQVIDPWEAEGGNDPGVTAVGAELKSTGTAAESAIAVEPKEGFSVDAPEGTIEVEPTAVGGSSSPAGIANEVAGMATNTATGADSVLRPTYAGLTDFSVIREAASPESYSWDVTLFGGQSLKEVDSSHAAVYAPDGTVVMLITAEKAHGADGKVVATSLAVTGPHTVTLTVKHRTANVVYPVVDGAGFEVGYSSVIVTPPPPPPPPEGPAPEDPGMSIQLSVSAPVPAPVNKPGEEASASFFGYRAIKTWSADLCPPDIFPILDECEIWHQHIKGFFYYDGHEAWHADNREPVCEHGSDPLHSVEEINCNWVGPNHQKYGGGYHITAQTRFYAGGNFIVAEKQGYHAATFRAFGDGNIFGHPTDQVCNPSRPGC